MSDGVFVDTNILIYARDRKSEVKRRQARAWLGFLAERQSARINLQVLNEFTRWTLANEHGRPVPEIRAEIDELRSWGDKPCDDEEVELAWAIRARWRFNWFDCLLVAAAERFGCRYFLTEDMIDRAIFGSVTLVNPFEAEPSDLLARH